MQLEDEKEVLGAKKIIKRILKDYLSHYSQKLFFSLILMVIVAVTSAFHVWLIKPALDGIFIDKNHELLVFIPFIIFLIALVKGIAAYYQNFLIKFIGQSIVNDMQLQLYKHLIYADINFLKSHSSGNLISRFTNDITNLRNSVANIVTNITKESLTAIFLICVMFTNDVTLSFITLFIFPLAVIPIMRMGKRMRKVSGKTQEELGTYTSKLDEVFRNIRAVKSFTAEEREIRFTNKVLNQILQYYAKAIRTDSLTSPLMELLGGLAFAAVIWYGGIQVLNGETSAGSFFSFIAALLSLYKPLKSLADINVTIQSGIASAKRVFKILDTNFDIESDNKNLKKLHVKQGVIEFENVCFAHDDSHETIKNLSLTIPSGQFVAIVGASGSGKSTLVDLLLKFFKPSSGTIKIDNQDISKFDNKSVRQSISLVSQDVMIFENTIKENIRYGNPKATDKDIENAAKIAAAHEFISKLPNKYETDAGQFGLKLSGGQRQRICIARAILKNSPILVFDEATSSLDQISEFKIKESIENLRKKHTIIVIAHRLSTIQDADKIFVLEKGKIAEEGTHEQLMSRKSQYYSLYNRQKESN